MEGFDMSINIPRGKTDAVIDRIIEALRAYEVDHPNARIDLYRQNPVSVRVRIVDPDFAGRSKIDRSKEVWKYLNSLSDEIQSDLSALILLTTEETSKSIANLEFEDPIPSSL
jgi:stress-induced morphogen